MLAGWRDRPDEIGREQEVAYEQELDRFFTACATHAAACGFGGHDPETAFDDLLATLDATPIDSSDPTHPGPVHGDDVRLAAMEMLLDPSRWQGLATALAHARAGDGALVQAIVDGAVDNETDLDPFVANHAVTATIPAPARRDPCQLRLPLRPRSITSGRKGRSSSLVAHRWPVRAADSFRGDFEQPADAPTILVIGGTHDPATPYQWAVRATADLGNARLLTYRSDGHGAINDNNPCVVFPVLAYLTDPTVLPAEGATCAQDIDPFGP